jgi:hypothetical protein
MNLGNGSWASWGPSNVSPSCTSPCQYLPRVQLQKSLHSLTPEQDAATQNVHATVLDQEKPNYV